MSVVVGPALAALGEAALTGGVAAGHWGSAMRGAPGQAPRSTPREVQHGTPNSGRPRRTAQLPRLSPHSRKSSQRQLPRRPWFVSVVKTDTLNVQLGPFAPTLPCFWAVAEAVVGPMDSTSCWR